VLSIDQAFKDITNTKPQQKYNLKHSNNEEDENLEELKSHHLTSLREKKTSFILYKRGKRSSEGAR
jgi:hypothetical protein